MKFFCTIAIVVLGVPAWTQTKPAPAKPPVSPKAKAPTATKPGGVSTAPAPKGPAATEPAGAPSTLAGPSSAEPVLTVGEENITQQEFEGFLQILPENIRAQASNGPMKRQIAQEIARVKVLAAEARRRGLDKDKTTQTRIAFQTENLLAGAVFNEMLTKAPVDDAALQKYYDDHKNEWEQAQARHVLVRFKGSPVPIRAGQKELSDEEALAKVQGLRKRLAGGEDFATIAKAESDDQGSGANGGDLGTFKRGMMVEAFDKAAFSLPVGEISEPLKTQFGYHLIQVQKRDNKSFADAKPEIENKVRPDVAKNAVEALVKKTSVVYSDAYFGPEPAATPAPPPAGGTGAAPPAAK
jgi:peptidyl-prolyl cis-trans isomerase C